MEQKRKRVMIMLGLFVFARIMVYIEGYLVYKMNNIFGVRIPVRVILSIVMLSCTYMYIDKDVFVWSWKKCGYAITRLSPVILLNSILAVIVVGSILKEQRGWIISETFIFEIICAIILSLVVSLYEEGLYRGIITGGLQKIFVQNKRNIWLVVLLSGAVFGFVHIVSYFEMIKYHPGIATIQMIITFLKFGSAGVLVAAVYIRTRNIWGGIVAHFLIDVIPYIMQIVMNNSRASIINNNVSENSSHVNMHISSETIVINMITCVFYLVTHLLITWRIITNMQKENQEDTRNLVINEEISVTTDSFAKE